VRIRSVFSHTAQALAEGALIALIVVGLVAGSAFAARGGSGKPGGGSTATGTLAVKMVVDANGNGSPNYGDDITFTFSQSATTTPMVGLRCWQGTNFVYDGYVGYFPNAVGDEWFGLSSNYWTPTDPANCTARLFYFDNRGREHLLDTLNFGVAP
jgi:hypothetical protein